MSKSSMLPQCRTLKMLWWATFWVSFPFGILSFVLPIYGKELGATALEVGGFFSATSLVPVVARLAVREPGTRPFTSTPPSCWWGHCWWQRCCANHDGA